MQVQTIQVDKVVLHAHQKPDGEDGYVLYLVLIPKVGYENACLTHPGLVHRYEMQPFTRGNHTHRKGASKEDIEGNHANLWGWNGDPVGPSLEPSLLANRLGDWNSGYVFHGFFRGGRIELCSDSTVRLEMVPRACHVSEESPA